LRPGVVNNPVVGMEASEFMQYTSCAKLPWLLQKNRGRTSTGERFVGFMVGRRKNFYEREGEAGTKGLKKKAQ
jgi:hypothetical protein